MELFELSLVIDDIRRNCKRQYVPMISAAVQDYYKKVQAAGAVVNARKPAVKTAIDQAENMKKKEIGRKLAMARKAKKEKGEENEQNTVG